LRASRKIPPGARRVPFVKIEIDARGKSEAAQVERAEPRFLNSRNSKVVAISRAFARRIVHDFREAPAPARNGPVTSPGLGRNSTGQRPRAPSPRVVFVADSSTIEVIGLNRERLES
jgi:hypothetical protein